MSYLTIAIPATLKAVGNKIAIAFEPDSGVHPDAYDAFALQATDGTTQYLVYGAPVVDWLEQSALLWKYAPDQLHAATVEALARFPDVTPPTLAEVTDFTTAALISTVWGTQAGLDDLGLTKVEAE